MRVIDTRHLYRGYHSDGAVCGVEVHRAPGRPPLVVCTELLENRNTSVTNMAEFLAAEVAERYLLPEWSAGFDPPFLWIERYERVPGRGRASIRHDYDLVTFDDYERRPTSENAPLGGFRHRIGRPRWSPLDPGAFAALVGAYGDASTPTEATS